MASNISIHTAPRDGPIYIPIPCLSPYTSPIYSHIYILYFPVYISYISPYISPKGGSIYGIPLRGGGQTPTPPPMGGGTYIPP